MDFLKLLKETEERFRDRTPIRTDQKKKIAAGLPLQADTPERVEKRLKRLGLEPATAKMMVGSDFPIIPSIVEGHERILDTNDLVSVNFLERGALAARSIGRIRVRTGNGQGGFGTGFLVSPRLFLTNNHVLPDAQSATLSRVEFNYQDGVDGNLKQPIVFNFQPDALFITDAALDYSLVAINPIPQNGTSLSMFGWLPLIEAEGKVIVGESVSIIQHPDGDPKQVALRGNKLVDALPDFLHYETDTAPGSSGSPVFNDQWEVVALHHSGVPKRDADGKILSVDGLPWAKEQGEHRIAWIANEGVRISRIIQHLRSQTLSATAQGLVSEMLNGNSPNLHEMSPSKPESEASQATPEELQTQMQSSLDNQDGIVTWTIPLQVSVRLGQPVIQAQPAIVASTPNIPVVPSLAPTPEPIPAPVAPTMPGFEALGDKDLKDALKDLKGATKKPYYDEKSDRAQRDAYYQTILSKLDSLSEADLYQELKDLVIKTHTTKLTYKPGKHLYSWVDLHPDLKIRSIYSEQVFEPADLIRADFQIDQLRAVRSQELQLKEFLTSIQFMQELNVLEASLPYNCEHVVPQSWFAKKEPMRGDLHHLFACETRCNSFRGNTPYFDFEDFGTVIRDQCGKLVGEKFEPGAGKGAVARATLYFLLRYPGEINKTEREYQSDRLPILLDWHRTHPVTEYEKHRNAAIHERQGNRNPLIDFPEWADQIDFRLGLG